MISFSPPQEYYIIGFGTGSFFLYDPNNIPTLTGQMVSPLKMKELVV